MNVHQLLLNRTLLLLQPPHHIHPLLDSRSTGNVRLPGPVRRRLLQRTLLRKTHPSSPAHEKPTVTDTGALARSGRCAAAALLVALAALLALPLQGHAQTSVPHDWSLKPSGLDTRDKFRLLFVSSTKRNANPSDIAIYNTFVQTRAAAGHTDIQAYSAGFKVVGCTATVDAIDNTGTTGTGVPIYWLDGDRVADDYADFYDGSWDSRSPTNETGASVTTTSTDGVITGCSAIGTDGGAALGDDTSVWMGNPSGNNNVLSGALSPLANARRLYGLSVVFEVSASTDAKLSALVVNDGTNDRTLTPTFVPGTFDYDADVGNAITTVTLTATVNNANASVTGVTLDGTAIADTDFSDGITVPSLAEDDNEIVVTVTAENNINNTKDYTVTVSRARRRTTTPTPPGEVEVPNNWILIPTGLVTGDKFRLLFLSSTSTDGSSYDIADYNTFVQGRAAAGHTDIQAYSSAFRVVGCTSDSDATANTGTAYNSAVQGVPIHWLNGNKVADNYADFYDGSWDDEANDKNELGANGPDTSQTANYPMTGCQDYGEEATLGGRSLALGQPTPRVGRPNSSATGSGPIHSLSFVGPSDSRPMYGLSQVFEVGAPTDVTLSDLELEGAPGGETIHLIPAFDSATETYTASVANRIAAVTLTATKNDTNATVAIASDDDTSTEDEAELDLNVGSNTLTLTVTAADATPKTYTITLTRAAAPPAPTDCPADTDWCTTLGVGYATESTASFKLDYWGYRSDQSFGDLLSPTFSHGGTGYTMSQLDRQTLTNLPGNTVHTDKLNILVGPALPDGTVLQLGSRTFTVDTDSATGTIGQEQWSISGNPLSWTAGQHVTASLKFPTAPDLPTGLTATASGATQINLVWVAPTDNGGSTITGYKIEVSADGGTNWTDLLANTGTTSVTYSHTGLTRGSTRHYRVSAINAVGTGAASDPTSATTANATGQPAITGAAQVGKVLTAGLGTIADIDGLPGTFPDDYTFQWVRVDADGTSNEADLSGETSGTYTPVAADVGKKIKVKVSFTDDGGTLEDPLPSPAYPSNAPVAAAAGACPAVNDWCTTLTVGFSENELFKYYGFSTAITDDGLADTTIDDGDGTTWTVSTMVIADAMINDQVHINLDAFLARGSVFDLGGTTFTTDETSESTVTTGNYSWLIPAGFAWVHGQDVTVSVKLPANAPATGAPAISGSPQVGETLSAGTTGIMDLDGLTSVSYTYQWIRVDVDGTSNPVDVGTDDEDYTLVAADEGKRIKVQVTFTDDVSNAEELTSAAYLTPSHHSYPDRGIMPAQTACPASTEWCATMTVGFQLPGTDNTEFGFSASPAYGALDDTSFDYDGSTFTVVNVGIRNPDGMSGYHVRLGLDAFVPRGAVFDLNGYTFTADADAEQMNTGRYRWTLPASFRIAEGVDYRVSLQLTDNTPAEGKPTISGTATVGETLTAAIGDIADTDGLPTTFPDDYTFEWLRRDGGTDSPITGATASTYTPVAADVGKTVKVTVSFTDDGGTGEARTSDAYPSSGTIVSDTLPALSFVPTVVNVDEDAGPAILTVELTPASTGTVTVDFATRDHGAKAGEDYTATSGTLTFTAGQTSKTITVPILNDDVYESSGATGEIFFVDLSNPTGATLPFYSSATVSIDSEDAVPTASMADVTVDEGAGTMTLTLRLNHPSQVDIAYFTRDDEVTGTATEGEDYDDFLLETGRIARITVPGGSLSQTFDITLVDDGVDEPDETIVIIWQKLSTSDVTPSTINFTGTIVPDTLPALSFAPNIVTVDEDAGSATLTVELAPASSGTVTVDYATRDSAAKAGEDYTATSGTLTFTAGQTSKTITVPILNDDVYENDESFFVDLSNPTGATLPASVAAVGIDSEDAVPTASLADVTVDEGAGTMTLTLRLSHPSQPDITYLTSAGNVTGTATEGDDYDDFLLGPGRTARITVPGGELSQTFDITLVDDGVDEPDETIVIEWIRNSNDDATPDFIIFTGTITDNDTADNNPTVRFGASSYTAIEGVAGAVVTVELNPAATHAVTIPVTTTPQGGASSADYSGVPGSVTFAAGETEKSFTVRATDDSADDDGESVQLGFGRLPSGVALGSPSTATVALVAGSGVSTWFLFFEESSYTAIEGGTAARVTVGLSNPWKPALNESLTIGIFTPEHRGGADASDYSGVPKQVTFQPGQTRVSFTVTATNDSDDDDGESIYLQFAGFDIEDLELGRAPRTTTVHLRDNDGASAVQAFFGAQTYRVNEGSAVTVSVHLDKAPGRELTILITTAPGNGASSADYSGVPGSITFSGSQSMRTFDVQAQNDNVNDDQEYLTFGFGELPASVSAGDPATTTLNLVDTNDSISIRTISFDAQDTNVRELLEGSIYSLYVYLDRAADNDIVVPLQVTHLDGATTADYSGLPETVIIPAGERRENVIIRVLEDAEDDHGEGIRVRFGSLPRGVRKDNRADTATFRFLDNDTLPAISIAGADVKEWPNPQSYLNFVASLDYAPEFEVAVDYRTLNGSAVAGQDYESRSGTLTFAEGERSKYIRVLVCHDGIDESTETMTLQLSNPVRTKLQGNGSATGSIRNNNGSGAKPCATGISVSDVSAPEPNIHHLQRQEIEFEVSLNQADTGTVSADYRTVNGSATAGQDYESASGTVTFRPGQTRRTVKVVVVADAHDDPGETFTLRLSNPSGAYIGDGEGTATLTNSGPMPGAWLSRFGRVASDHAVQAIEARIYDTSGHARENHLTIGGQRVDWQMLGRFAPSRGGRPGPGQRGDRAAPAGVAPRLDPWLGDQAARTRMDRLGAKAMAVGSLSVGGMADLDAGGNPAIDSLSDEGMTGVDSGRVRGSGGGDAKGTFRRAVMDLLGLEDFSRLSQAGIGLMGSSFFYSRPGGDETPGWLGPWSLWGETAVTRFDGAEGPLSLNGDVTTATVGFDTRRERWMGGLVLAYSEGQGAYTHRSATGGAMDSSLTSLIPYASYSLNERTSVWGTLGYGVGDLTLTPEGATSGIETDLSTAMAAVGGRGVFSVRTAGAAQFEFAVRADARFTSTVSDAVENLAGAVGATSRVRAVLEGRGSVPLAWGGDLSPRLEVGLRYDGGDAETGAGLEIGAGLGYAAGNLSAEVSARGLVAHEDTAYEEWGFSSSISYAPSEDGRGLSMRLGSAWGATQSGVQSLWNQQDASGLARSTAFEAAQRLQAELGYGIAGRGRNSLWVPFIAAQAADGGGQALRTGLKLTSGPDFEVGLELGRRQGRPGADPEHTVQLHGRLHW